MKSIIIVASALILFSSIPSYAENAKRVMTLTGIGEISAAPDIANIDLGVISEGNTARDALRENTVKMSEVMRILDTQEITSKDIQTSGFNLEPRHFYDPNQKLPPKITGYQINNTVHVIIRDLARFGDILDAVVTGGSNTIQRLSFSFSEPEKLRDKARKLAGGDARRRAQLYAEGLGIELGSIIRVVEQRNIGRPVQMMERAASSSSVPIAAGEQSVSVSIEVTFEIE
jgi:uncharacterized protein YggE